MGAWAECHDWKGSAARSNKLLTVAVQLWLAVGLRSSLAHLQSTWEGRAAEGARGPCCLQKLLTWAAGPGSPILGPSEAIHQAVIDSVASQLGVQRCSSTTQTSSFEAVTDGWSEHDHEDNPLLQSFYFDGLPSSDNLGA